MNDQFESKSNQLRSLLAVARRVTICMDSWTKKGLTASFLGISACFFDQSSERPIHAFLSLMEIKHPHTGEKLAECLKKWDICPEKVLLVVTDNGANIIKAVKLLQSQYAQSSNEVSDEEDECDETDNEENEKIESDEDQIIMDLPEQVTFRRMQCMAHTLQLVIKPVFKHYGNLLAKTRQLINKIRKSGPGVEKLIEKCGKSVLLDCPTRWNSTYTMIKRLVEIKQPVPEVSAAIGNIITLLSTLILFNEHYFFLIKFFILLLFCIENSIIVVLFFRC